MDVLSCLKEYFEQPNTVGGTAGTSHCDYDIFDCHDFSTLLFRESNEHRIHIIMIDPNKVLNTIEKAILAFKNTPGRSGRVLRLANTSEVLVVGDLHGRVDHLKKAFTLADLKANPKRTLIVQELIHGTTIHADGSDNSHLVLDMVASLKCQFPNQVHYLLGNHELSQVTSRQISKNNIDLNQLFDQGVAFAYPAMVAQIKDAYKNLISVIPAMILLPNQVCISHSLPDKTKLESFDPKKLELVPEQESDLFPGGNVHSLVWGRDTSLENAENFLNKVRCKWLVTGHIPCNHGFDYTNSKQIILDAHFDNAAGYCRLPADQEITGEVFLKSGGLL